MKAISTILIALIIYGIIAFVQLELNPIKFHWVGRLFLVLIVGIYAAFGEKVKFFRK